MCSVKREQNKEKLQIKKEIGMNKHDLGVRVTSALILAVTFNIIERGSRTFCIWIGVMVLAMDSAMSNKEEGGGAKETNHL